MKKSQNESKITNVKPLSTNNPSEIKITESAINDRELQIGMERFLKEKEIKSVENKRDVKILTSQIAEYLDSYIVFGYDMNGERILIEHHSKARDYDALMEFLKIVCYRHDGILSSSSQPEEDDD